VSNKKQNLYTMKKIIVLICGLLIFTCASAQNKIKAVSTYFPKYDSISLTKTDLDYLLKKSYIVCSKIDTLDDGAMVKILEIECRDTTFRFLGAYMESAIFYQNSDVSISDDGKFTGLKCEFVVVDNGQLYEAYELDTLGKKYFENLLNKTRIPVLSLNLRR